MATLRRVDEGEVEKDAGQLVISGSNRLKPARVGAYYHAVKKIGEGSFGTIYKGITMATSDNCIQDSVY